MNKGSVCFPAAGILLIATWLLYFFALHDPALVWLVYTGWAILAAGLLFILLSILTLRGRGRPEKEKDFAHTTRLVDSGGYALVRHPLYLGWLLMYVAAVFFSQHWLILLTAVPGIACMLRIAQQEDRHLVEKFGGSYKTYMKSVPALNFLAGILRLLKNKKR